MAGVTGSSVICPSSLRSKRADCSVFSSKSSFTQDIHGLMTVGYVVRALNSAPHTLSTCPYLIVDDGG